VFTGFVTVYLTLETFLSFFQPPVGASCGDLGASTWHWRSIIWLDTLQSALMVVLVVIFELKNK
jgi:hypothetical protein